MSEEIDDHEYQAPRSDSLTDFQGMTRLFPLPNVVLFPGVLLPLHIFEPRYRQMVTDAMDSDRLITLVLLKPGYESDYEGSPPIHSVGCLGRIHRHEPLPDGRSLIILHGLRRVRIETEVPTGCPYRTALASILKEQDEALGGEVSNECRDLVAKTLKDMGVDPGPDTPRKRSRSWPFSLGEFIDFASHTLSIDVEAKQMLLEELDLRTRIAMVTGAVMVEAVFDRLEKQLDDPPRDASPPKFSDN